MDNNNDIELKPIKDILGMNFFIPNYQRGYRWKEQQVIDLLEDIYSFSLKFLSILPSNSEAHTFIILL